MSSHHTSAGVGGGGGGGGRGGVQRKLDRTKVRLDVATTCKLSGHRQSIKLAVCKLLMLERVICRIQRPQFAN